MRRRLRWTTWLAGVVVFSAAMCTSFSVYFVAPNYWRSSRFLVAPPTGATDNSISFGWPASFARAEAAGELELFWPAAVIDLTALVILVGGTMVSVEQWMGKAKFGGWHFVAASVTILLWWLMWITLQTEWLVFAGWSALFVIFASVPCVCHALIVPSTIPWIPRFTLRTMFLVFSAVCAATAVITTTGDWLSAVVLLVLAPLAYRVIQLLAAASN